MAQSKSISKQICIAFTLLLVIGIIEPVVTGPDIAGAAPPGPGGPGSDPLDSMVNLMEDDFEEGGSWPTNYTRTSSSRAGVGTQTSNSGSYSMYTGGGAVTIESKAVDTSGHNYIHVEFWLRNGDNSFSEQPDSGENLRFYYYNSVGTWVLLETFFGSATPGTIYTRSYNLSGNALHSGFKIRFNQNTASCSSCDYYHIDDVYIKRPLFEHDIEIQSVDVPSKVEKTNTVSVNTTIFNSGNNSETNVTIQQFVDGVMVNSTNITSLPKQAQKVVRLNWTVMGEGTVNLRVYAVPQAGEGYTINNNFTKVVEAFADPEGWCNASDFNFTAETGMTDMGNLTFGNSGIGNLTFNITINSFLPGGSRKVLIYNQYSDKSGSGEYENTKTAINQTTTDYSIDFLTDYTKLDTKLPGHNILLVPEQELEFLSKMQTIGAAWKNTLNSFLASGGRIIICDHTRGAYGIYTGAGLMTISSSSDISSSTLTIAEPTSPLAAGVSSSYTAPSGSVQFTTSETDVIVKRVSTPVVIHKKIGNGDIILIGHDYYNIGSTDANKIVGNSILSYTPIHSIKWLEFSQENGTVGFSQQIKVNVTANATQLNPGVYRANITVTTNDLINKTYTFPVNFTVLPAPHDIRVLKMDVPSSGEAGKIISVNATIFNQGTKGESNVQVQLKINGVMVNSTTISSMTASQQTNITLTWQPMSENNFTVEIYVVPLALENQTWNNNLTMNTLITAESDISVSPGSYDLTVETRRMTTRNLTLENLGLGQLNWSIKTTGLLFQEDFEDGDYNGWQDGSGSYTRQVVSSTAAAGTTKSFSLTGGSQNHQNGIYKTFTPGLEPEYVGFYIRTSTTSIHNAFIRLTDGSGSNFVYIYAQSNGSFNFYYGSGSYWKPYTTNTWYHFEMKNIDWTAKTFDYYFEGSLVKAGTSFPAVNISRIDLYNWQNSQSWFDEISFSGDSTGSKGWVTTKPFNGSIAQLNQTNVTVIINATLLKPGFYQANITITTNDPDTPTIIIPVNLTVIKREYDIAITPNAQVEYGKPGKTIPYRFTLINEGRENETFDLKVTGNTWVTKIYESTGSSEISTIYIPINTSKDIIVKVTIPPSAAPRTTDIVTLTASSQKAPVEAYSALITTNTTIPIPFYDDFEKGVLDLNWTVGGSTGLGGVSTHTSNSGSNSMYTHGGTIVSTEFIDTSSIPILHISFWIRRGGSFSDAPDNGEHLFVEYLNATGSWVSLETFLGGGTWGEIFKRQFNMTGDVIHSEFKLRFRQDFGSSTIDFWHIDDVYIGPPPPIVLAVYGKDKAPPGVEQNEVDVTMAHFNFTATNGTITVNSVSVNLTGSGISSDIAKVKLVLDEDSSYDYTYGEKVLAVGTFTAGQALLSGTWTVVPGTTKSILITFTIAQNAFIGKTVGVKLIQADFSMDYPGIVSPFTDFQSTNSLILEKSDFLDVKVTDTAPTTAWQNQKDVPVMLMELSALLGNVTITEITFDLSGKCSGTDIDKIDLYIDSDSSGKYEPGKDTALGSASCSAGKFIVNGFSITINDTAPLQLLVMVDISEAAVPGNTVGLCIRTDYITVDTPDLVLPIGPYWGGPMIIVEEVDLEAPEPPINLRITGVTHNSISLAWDESTEADLAGYNIYRNAGSVPAEWGLPVNGGTLVADAFFTDVKLKEMTTYYYVITAVDEVPNESEFSNTAFGTTILGPRKPIVNNSLADFSILEDGFDDTTINLKTVFMDPNKDNMTFRCDGQENIEVTIFQETGAVALRPRSDWNGQETLKFYANDGKSPEVLEAVTVTITPVNDPPGPANIFSPIDGAVYDHDTALKFSGFCTDIDEVYGDVLTYRWTSNISGEIGTGEALTDITLPSGKHLVTLEVADSAGATSSDTVKITFKVDPDSLKNDTKVNDTNGDVNQSGNGKKPIDGDQTSDGDDKEGFNSLYLILLIIIVALIVVFVLFMVMKKKKEAEAETPPPPEPSSDKSEAVTAGTAPEGAITPPKAQLVTPAADQPKDPQLPPSVSPTPKAQPQVPVDANGEPEVQVVYTKPVSK
jgi:hypothetical protein